MTPFDRLRDRARTTGGVLAVGLHPDLDRLPDDCREYDYPRRAFNRRVVDATSDHTAAYTLNPAYYRDSDGRTALAETVTYAHGKGVPVVLDGKWAAVEGVRPDLLDAVDAVTLAPDPDAETLAAVSERGAAAFAVCRTPNRGAADLQAVELAGGETLAERVAERTAQRAAASGADVGLLVGGSSDDLEALRERTPDLPFLAVGGARNDPDVAGHVTADGVGLVAVSREVIYAGETAGRGRGGDAYADAARQAAGRLKRRLRRE